MSYGARDGWSICRASIGSIVKYGAVVSHPLIRGRRSSPRTSIGGYRLRTHIKIPSCANTRNYKNRVCTSWESEPVVGIEGSIVEVDSWIEVNRHIWCVGCCS